MCNAGYSLVMQTDIHTDADRHVADVLKRQFQGRSVLDWDEVASAAIGALFEYEEELNEKYLLDHPQTKTKIFDEAAIRRTIAAEIRSMLNIYGGTASATFALAREQAAKIALGDA